MGANHSVMAGLFPAIYIFGWATREDVDARDKFILGPAFGRTRVRGHDGA